MMSNHEHRSCGVLVLGDLRQTLTVVRSLSRAGYWVVLGRCEAGYAVGKSRCVADVWEYDVDTEKSPQRFARALAEYLDSHPEIGCVFPVGEKDISLLTSCGDLLPRSVAYAMPGETVVKTCLNKIATLRLLGELGVPLAEYRVAEGRDELNSAIEGVGYPCIVKAETEQTKIFGLKALVLHSCEELNALIEQWPKGSARWIVQKYFVGDRRNVYFFAKKGRLLSSVEVHIGRTDRVDGTGYAVEGVSVAPTASLNESTKRLIERLDYTGVGCTQFLVDETGEKTTFLEINARLGANFAIAYRCGLDLPRWWVESALVESALGVESPISPAEGAVGKRYCWLYGDVQGFKHALFGLDAPVRELLAWPLRIVRSWLLADTHVTWDWQDPMPSLSKMAEMFSGPLRRVSSVFAKIPRRWSCTRPDPTLG